MQLDMVRYWALTPIVFLLSPFSSKFKLSSKERRKRVEMIRFLSKTDDEGKERAKRLVTEANPMFPFWLQEKYKNYYKRVEVKRDMESGLLYTFFNGRKLFLKRSFTVEKAKRYIAGITEDQDIDSPHYYPYGREDVLDKTVADLGGAEGFFALSVVEWAKKIYVFEREEGWLEALKKTFAPFKEKVEIVPLFVSDKDGEGFISLDTFFSGREIDLLKADIEGFEVPMLDGAKETFKKLSKAIICLYHNHDDERKITSILNERGFGYTINKERMLVLMNIDDVHPPYLRPGVLVAQKL